MSRGRRRHCDFDRSIASCSYREMSTQTVRSLALGLLVGLAAWPLATTWVKPVRAEPPKTIKKWEQYCTWSLVMAGGPGGAVDKANVDIKKKGDEGWELASAAYTDGGIVYCFKRPAP
jgi:hypothetical protein